MKKILKILVLLLIVQLSWGQTQEPTADDYQETYLKKRSSLRHSSTKAFKSNEQEELDEVINDLKASYPNSYQLGLLQYVNSGYSDEYKEELFAANTADSKDEDVIKYMLAYYIIHDNQPKVNEYVKKVDDFYSKNKWDYYRDLINTTEIGIIITSNHDDTYPLLSSQMLYEIGSGIKVVCLDFLQNDTYRKKVQQWIGMEDTPFLGKEKLFLAKLLKESKTKVIVSSTVNQNYLAQVETSMYLVGLGYEYNCKDQYERLERFWKKIQKRAFNELNLSSTDRKLYTNYLPPLLTLYRLKWNKRVQDPVLKKTIQLIGIKVKKEDEVEEILKAYESE